MVKITESTTQETIIGWCRKNNIFVCSIPNGGTRNIREAVQMKREGLLAGMPDLFFPDLFMFMELKTETGKLSDKQVAIIDRLRENYKVYVCRSAFEAINIIKSLTK